MELVDRGSEDRFLVARRPVERVEGDAAFAAIVGYVAYGLLVSIVWVRVFAPDVAMTEAAVGSGVTGILLISAAVRLRYAERAAAAEQSSVSLRLCAAILCLAVTGALAAVVLLLPDPGPTLAPQAAERLARDGRHQIPTRRTGGKSAAQGPQAPSCEGAIFAPAGG
jgi:uncharacterized MnhB-related membrane protein